MPRDFETGACTECGLCPDCGAKTADEFGKAHKCIHGIMGGCDVIGDVADERQNRDVGASSAGHERLCARCEAVWEPGVCRGCILKKAEATQ